MIVKDVLVDHLWADDVDRRHDEDTVDLILCRLAQPDVLVEFQQRCNLDPGPPRAVLYHMLTERS